RQPGDREEPAPPRPQLLRAAHRAFPELGVLSPCAAELLGGSATTEPSVRAFPPMFDSLRDAFREAIKNFKEELHRDEVPEAVDGLVRGMKQEYTAARARLHDLEEGIRRARAEAAIEAQELEKCQRRERMATS